ncbi:MAG: hypothetical protein GY909_09080 [Oligoflexia bacterium]|nr:hypothetical protein [Oligoflexia bacterium]
MTLKILLPILLLFSINATEIEEGCEHFYENVYQDVEKKLPFHLSKMCEGLPDIKTQAELKEVLKFYYDRLKKFEKANRHDTNKATVTWYTQERIKSLSDCI